MPAALQGIPVVVLLLAATILEVSGDAVVRLAIYNHIGLVRLGLFLAGAALLFGYGAILNLAPLEFGQVVGLYLATLLVVWQVISFVAFRALPTLPIVVGGALVVAWSSRFGSPLGAQAAEHPKRREFRNLILQFTFVAPSSPFAAHRHRHFLWGGFAEFRLNAG